MNKLPVWAKNKLEKNHLGMIILSGTTEGANILEQYFTAISDKITGDNIADIICNLKTANIPLLKKFLGTSKNLPEIFDAIKTETENELWTEDLEKQVFGFSKFIDSDINPVDDKIEKLKAEIEITSLVQEEKTINKKVADNQKTADSNLSDPNISETGIVNNGPRNKKTVALTFDADMTPGMLNELKNGKVKSWYNSEIPRILEENDVKATIFISGLWAETYPEVVKSLANKRLFEIANHSNLHKSYKFPCYGLPVLADDKKKQDISDAQSILTKLTGLSPKYFRFPGGCCDQKDIDLVEKLGLKVIGWDVAGDAFQKDKNKIVKLVLRDIQKGSIIVLHFDGGRVAPMTAAALPEIIKGVKEKGLSFVTLSEMLD